METNTIKEKIEKLFDTTIDNLVCYTITSGDHRSVFISHKDDVEITRCSLSYYRLHGNTWDIKKGAKFIEIKEDFIESIKELGDEQMSYNEKYHLFEHILYFAEANIKNARKHLNI
jgi:hypothetical protein